MHPVARFTGGSTHADIRAGGTEEVRLLAQRLDQLQSQLDELNAAIRDHLKRERSQRRRRSANAELMRFSRQVRRFAVYAPC